jgi:hypothetical protein
MNLQRMPPRMLAQLIRFLNLAGAGQPIAERVNIHLVDFNFIFNQATLASPKVPLASQRNLPRLILRRMEIGTRIGFGDHDNAPPRRVATSTCLGLTMTLPFMLG